MNAVDRHDEACQRIGQAIERAAGDLPPGWEISVCVERHGYSVALIDPWGESIDMDGESMDASIQDGVQIAIEQGGS